MRKSKLAINRSDFSDDFSFKKARNNDLCLTKNDLLMLHEQIQNYYIDNGYVVARVYFDGLEISKGSIKIIIEEGKLEKIEIKDNSKLNNIFSWRRSLQKFFAFPSIWQDDVINLRDVEQGIDQINRLSSQSAKIGLEPAHKAGYSNVVVNNQIDHFGMFSLVVDNSGQKNTGKIKRKASFNYDNLIGINDNIYVNYSESNGVPLFGSSKSFNKMIGATDLSHRRFSKAFYGAMSIPFGYSTLGASYSSSKYLVTSEGLVSPTRSSGDSQIKTYYFDHVLWRGKKHKISLKAELEQNSTKSYIEQTFIPVNSRETAKANFYLNNTFYISGGTLYFQPKYSKGLSAFGALKDKKGLSPDKARAQFETFGFYAQSNINFPLYLGGSGCSSGARAEQGGSSPCSGGSGCSSGARAEQGGSSPIHLNHKLTFDLQKSNHSLYGSDKFSLGGRYTVRGFQRSIISGDHGYLFRNDLSAKLIDLTPKLLRDTKIFNFGAENFSLNSALAKMRFGIFHDYGYVRNYVIDDDGDKGYMSGAGAVLSFNGKFIDWDISYSKGLQSPRFLRNLDNIPQENEAIYFSLGINFGML